MIFVAFLISSFVGLSIATTENVCSAVGTETSFVAHSECTQYYECSNGVASLRTCPDGLHFNPVLRACDFKNKAGCNNANSNGVSLFSEDVDTYNRVRTCRRFRGDCPSRDGRRPVYIPQRDCSQFCQCSNGVPYLFTCPSGLQFNRRLNVCDWPQNVRCRNRRSIDAEDTDSEIADNESGVETNVEIEETKVESYDTEDVDAKSAGSRQCAFSVRRCPRRDGRNPVYLPLRNCNNFCQCSNGVPRLLSCPAGLHFNPRLNVCDWPSRAGCRGWGRSDSE